MDNINKMQEIFKANYRGDEMSMQKAILILKENGYSQMQSVKFLIEELNIPLKEADNIILKSIAWGAVMNDNLKARDKFEDTLREEDNSK